MTFAATYKQALLETLEAIDLDKVGQAIEWFRKGDWDTLIKYCKDDVKITSDVWLHGVEKKFVMIETWKEPKKVPVDWK